jgi:hypothetical protein
MKPRAYALTLLGASGALFLCLAATNVIVDPQGVFGTKLFPLSLNVNYHQQSVRNYQASPREYEGVLLGSSRAATLPLDDLSHRLGGVRLAPFNVAGGMLPDQLPAVEFVLRDKMRSGGRLRAVFLLIDIDAFGTRPWTNLTIETLLPPALSDENPVGFWWKNLTTFQASKWLIAIRQAHADFRSANPSSGTTQGVDLLVSAADAASTAVLERQARKQTMLPGAAGGVEQITQRPHFAEQLHQLERLARLCRQNGTKLLVATSPLHRTVESHLDPDDLAHAITRISRIVPIWDFTRAPWLSDDSARWLRDTSHFDGVTARMLVARMFGDPMPVGWTEFGRLRQP